MASRDGKELDDYVEFVHAAQHRLRRTAYLMTGDWAVAADLTQEALIKLYVAWPRLEKGGGLPTYARRAVVTTVLDYQRSRRRRPEEPRPDIDLRVAPDHTSGMAEREVLLEALRRTPPRQRATIVLRYLEGMSIAETAAAMRCSEGTVKSNCSAGIAALRRELRELDPLADWTDDFSIEPAGGAR